MLEIGPPCGCNGRRYPYIERKASDMANQAQRFCHHCKRKTLHVRDKQDHGCLLHIVVTILTLGLWLPFAMLMFGVSSLGSTFGPLRCQTCGVRYDSLKHPVKITKWGVVRFLILAAIVTATLIATDVIDIPR